MIPVQATTKASGKFLLAETFRHLLAINREQQSNVNVPQKKQNKNTIKRKEDTSNVEKLGRDML